MRVRAVGLAGALGLVPALVSLVVVAVMAPTASAAKAPDPCKVLKATEIQSAFGVAPGPPVKGLTTAASTSCTYALAALGTRPDGTLAVTVMFIGGKPAYDGLKTNPQFAPVPEVAKKALYQESTGALGTLVGPNYVTVQGVFRSGLPPVKFDVKPQLIPLAKIAAKRV